ncbi:HK97 gp10 family phage protein [Aerococcaceae bacterium WGS1372]
MSFTLKFSGLDKFLAQVARKGAEAQKAVDQELNRSSLRVERQAKILAPYDTGWLEASIYSYRESFKRYLVVSPVHYSIYLELGTRKTSAQPYMYPALESEAPKLFKNLQKMFGK